MAQKSSFFNSVSGDRKYNASDYAAFFGSFIGNGIYPNPSTNLAVSAAAGMNISVTVGKGWINGYYYENTSAFNMAIDVADGALKRIDRVVLRLDYFNREIILTVKKGNFSANPVSPVLTRTSDMYELALADVLINNGDTSISQANITDQRLNTALCGIVHSTVEQVDTTAIFTQYQAALNSFETTQQTEFTAWVVSLKDVLDASTAGNLLNLINTHKEDYTLQIPYAGVTTGTANTYAISAPAITALTAGMAVSVKFNLDSAGVSTLNWCGLGAKGIKKANGGDVTNLKATGIYTLRYDGVNFILQGEGGEYGTAGQPQTLTGYTLGTETGLKGGTMLDNGPGAAETINLTTEGAEYTIAAGFHSGLRKIKAVISGIAANVIKAGATVGGIAGTFTADATATASQMLANAKAYVNGVLVTGNIPSKVAATYTPSGSAQTIAAGQFLSGVQTISAVSVPAAKVLSDTNIAGTQGTMPNRGAVSITPSNIAQAIAEGYHNGAGSVAAMAITKSVQRGVVQVQPTEYIKNITITAVDLTKAVVIVVPKGSLSAPCQCRVKAKLTSATNVELVRENNLDSYAYLMVEWQVIEFNGVKSLQKGSITMADTTAEASVTISDVVPAKSIVFYSWKTNMFNAGAGAHYFHMSLLSSTQLRYYAYTNSGTRIAEWQVIEFY